MEYADEVMGDVDPEKVRVSEQLEKLRPVLQELAMIHKMPVEDVFIKYMDLATEAAVEKNNKFFFTSCRADGNEYFSERKR